MDASLQVAREFGRSLVRHRRIADISQEELGFRASLNRTEIGQLEGGKRLPRIDTLIKLAGALDLQPADLLPGVSWVPAETQVGHFAAQGSCGGAPDG